MKKIYLLLSLFISGIVSAQTYVYNFNGDFTEAGGVGPTLTEVLSCGATSGAFNSQTITTTSGVCGTKTAFDFQAGGGLSFDNSAGLIGSTYTIHMLFKFNVLSGYQRVIDFENGTFDYGLYIHDDCLAFHPGTGVTTGPGNCPNTAIPGTFYLVSIVRDGTSSVVKIYVDGVLNATYLDDGSNNSGVVVYNPPTAPIFLFRDNLSGGSTCEDQAGSIKYLSLSTSISSDADVANFFGSICATVLPLHLLDFTGNKQNSSVSLNWTTENEVNFSHFEIERSADGRSFSSLGSISANNSTTRNNYNFTDRQPLAGTDYYRLKMVDIDGHFKYSNILKINFDGQQKLEIYPNPVTDVMTISGIKSGGEIKLLNMEGKNLLQKIVAGQSTTIDISKYPTGLYIIQYFDGQKTENQKIVKQ